MRRSTVHTSGTLVTRRAARTSARACRTSDPLDAEPAARRADPRRPACGSRSTWWPRPGSTNADLAARPGAAQPAGLGAGHRLPVGRPRPARPDLDRPARHQHRHVGAGPARRRRPGALDLAAAARRAGGGRRPARRSPSCRRVLKWPNDVLVGERKICGILAERVETPTRAGLRGRDGHQRPPAARPSCRCRPPPRSRSPRPRPDPRSRREPRDRGQCWPRSSCCSGAGRPARTTRRLVRGYVERSATLGRRVRVELGERSGATGVAEAVDRRGRLVVRTAGGHRGSRRRRRRPRTLTSVGLPAKLLGADEYVVIHTRTHAKALMLPAFAPDRDRRRRSAPGGPGAGRRSGRSGRWPSPASGWLLVLWLVLVPFLRWRTTTYTITNRRLITRRGIFNKVGHRPAAEPGQRGVVRAQPARPDAGLRHPARRRPPPRTAWWCWPTCPTPSRCTTEISELLFGTDPHGGPTPRA